MGSATCFELARRGIKVLGLEQFSIPNELGSHSGQSRIIRKAYFEHPDYIPLLERAYEKWTELEAITGEQVFFRTGLLYKGPPAHPVIKGVLDAATKFSIEVNHLPAPELSSLYPALRMKQTEIALFEPDAGFLLPAKAISLFAAEAVKNGAVIHNREMTVGWAQENGKIKVVTDKTVYTADRLVITAGAWAAKMIRILPVALKVTRQVLAWVKPPYPEKFLPQHFPCWMIATPDAAGVYYGFPYLDDKQFGIPPGLKFALHFPGEETDPANVNRVIAAAETEALLRNLNDHFALEDAALVAANTCLYTNSPDEHFIIDHLPGQADKVTIACGFSGHGFKFASVVGEILADMVTTGKTNLPVDFLRLRRFGE